MGNGFIWDGGFLNHDCKKHYMYDGGLQSREVTLSCVGRMVSFMWIVTSHCIYSFSLPLWRLSKFKDRIRGQPR